MISLTTVKTYLGLSDTTYDAKITAIIPAAEAKYREIAGYDFNAYMQASYDSGASYITLDGIFSFDGLPNMNSDTYLVNYGDIIIGTGIADETYVTSIDKRYGKINISAATTSAGTEIYISTNISYRPIISGMIWYMIGQQSTTAQNEKQVKSKSVSPLSVTYADGEINSVYGIPQKFVNAIPKYAGIY